MDEKKKNKIAIQICSCARFAYFLYTLLADMKFMYVKESNDIIYPDSSLSSLKQSSAYFTNYANVYCYIYVASVLKASHFIPFCYVRVN